MVTFFGCQRAYKSEGSSYYEHFGAYCGADETVATKNTGKTRPREEATMVTTRSSLSLQEEGNQEEQQGRSDQLQEVLTLVKMLQQTVKDLYKENEDLCKLKTKEKEASSYHQSRNR
ncbi:hypothetical protein RJT34_22885 [Clitoria ternatea]|uniref:Uncharacterized protein n=1 Tax=Clitoria ternatea TaxID=43366 RepID=A0AAN9FMJ6_CLITE